jgi:hypothetical protein
MFRLRKAVSYFNFRKHCNSTKEEKQCMKRIPVIFRGCTLKHLEMSCHDVCNLLSSGSKRKKEKVAGS